MTADTNKQASQIHTCSYYCDRPECIKAQRDELRDRLAAPQGKARHVEGEDEYFAKRPQIDCNDRRVVFRAGFSAGQAAPQGDEFTGRKPIKKGNTIVGWTLPTAAPQGEAVAPEWNAASEAMLWLNEIEKYQGGANGPTIKLRSAILAMAAHSKPIGKVESAFNGAAGFHVCLAAGEAMPKVGVPLYTSPQPAAAWGGDPSTQDYASTQPAAGVEVVKPPENLCTFYGVSTWADLVAAQNRHIEKLQAKVPPIRDEQPGKARFA